eukprot:3780341-Amphidinium_carterae.1
MICPRRGEGAGGDARPSKGVCHQEDEEVTPAWGSPSPRDVAGGGSQNNERPAKNQATVRTKTLTLQKFFRNYSFELRLLI